MVSKTCNIIAEKLSRYNHKIRYNGFLDFVVLVCKSAKTSRRTHRIIPIIFTVFLSVAIVINTIWIRINTETNLNSKNVLFLSLFLINFHNNMYNYISTTISLLLALSIILYNYLINICKNNTLYAVNRFIHNYEQRLSYT